MGQPGRHLCKSINLSCARQIIASSIDQVLGAVSRRHHVVCIALNPVLRIQPWQNLLQELIGIALGDTELSDPDVLAKGTVEGLEVVLEVLGFVPCVVVGNDEVDLAVTAASHELLEPVHALVGLVAVGDRWGADPETLLRQGLDVLSVSSHCVSDGNVGASTTKQC